MERKAGLSLSIWAPIMIMIQFRLHQRRESRQGKRPDHTDAPRPSHKWRHATATGHREDGLPGL